MSKRNPSYDEIKGSILDNPNLISKYLLGYAPPRVPFLVSLEMAPKDFTYSACGRLLRFLNLGSEPYHLLNHQYCIGWSSVAGPDDLRDLLIQVMVMHLGKPLRKSSIVVMEVPAHCNGFAMWLPPTRRNPTNTMAHIYFPGADIWP